MQMQQGTPFKILDFPDMGVAYYAVWDEDTETYWIYDGADQDTADAVGEAHSVYSAKAIAKEAAEALMS
ncbi:MULTISPECIES: hypothetical protein [unclassified Caballeronia]|uniref:hypothetical protein n=1 Tax=unclassified Caballeronia TaxID=2646786 RepID=UPI0028670A05|nr:MULTISPECIES: hypothetical protein [unclassified Caballeronia]MDR5776970.1 hypothetical protein [Caballeronia sp. LZ002]MDR5852455.1 hypothetical protein [Caballeronia sp. LZ003]